MKLSILVPILAAALTRADELRYDTVYDIGNQSLVTVSCSNGANGLLTRGFTTFNSLPTVPNIGGSSAIPGFNSPQCGSCWNVTFTNAADISKSLSITVIDHAGSGFNVVSAQLAAYACGL
ncbi:hypothetical protein GYMLUDRAFT_101390 [Collybiopsis luxurians FD-317 M1]|uniref:Cerato-platanin n=1 Tax=Collybiopsis luxurians FD-317 M1 TaxID=944289 RepID=A0A0D0B6N3_9AGAR|nr:hypothetical protein GYMLUDRAFT_101390 [Collybiopsis luxurians FD-317 M1]